MIKSHKDLLIWQKGMDIVIDIYQLTDKLPSKEQFGLISQMRRATVSIPSNIAEGYGRQSKGSYVQFLSVARGSLLELQTQLDICIRLCYLTISDCNETEQKIIEVSKMISSLITKISRNE